MNISIVFTSQAKKAQPYVALAQQLREQVATLDSSFVVASSPDIVHVFGGFDKATKALLAKYRDMRIPTVMTACDALAAYTAGKQTIDRSQLSRSRRKLLMLATAVHAVGNEEGAALAATAPKADVSVVANPVVTTTVSAKTMTASFMQLYQAPRQMGFLAASAILIGGATTSRAKISNVVIGTFLFQGVLTLGMPVANALVPQSTISETLRILISNGIILYALTKSGGANRG